MPTLPYAQVSAGSQTHTGDTNYTDIPGDSLASSNFVPGKEYLLLVRRRLKITGSELGMKVLHGSTDFSESIQEGNIFSPTNSIHYGWFTLWTAISGEGIKGQYLTEDAGQTVGVETPRILAVEMSQHLLRGRDYFFNEDSGSQLLGTGFTAGATLTFTPPAPGRYLVWAYDQCVTHASDSGTSMISRLTVDASEVLRVRQEGKPNADLRLLPMCWWVDLDVSSHTINVETAATTGSIHTRQHSAIFMWRMNSMEIWGAGKGLAEIDMGGVAYGDVINSMQFPVFNAGPILCVCSTVCDQNALDTLGRQRMQLDGATISADTEDTCTAWDATDEHTSWHASVEDPVSVGRHTLEQHVSDNPGAGDRPNPRAEDYIVAALSLKTKDPVDEIQGSRVHMAGVV